MLIFHESQKINQALIRIEANNILNHGARNISYYLDNQNIELLDHFSINEQNGAIFLVKKMGRIMFMRMLCS